MQPYNALPLDITITIGPPLSVASGFYYLLSANNQMAIFNFIKANTSCCFHSSTPYDNTSPSFSDITQTFHYLTLLFLSMQPTDAKCAILDLAICIRNGSMASGQTSCH